MRSAGIDISRQTLSSGCVKVAETLRPLYELMKQEIISRGIIFADETPVKMLNPGTGKTKKTYIWVYAAGGKGPPFRIYDFTLQRNHTYPEKMLKDFKAYLHADAFGGYNVLFKDGSIIECACWMHVRRKYIEAGDAPVTLRNKVLRLIRNLYRYERAMKNFDREIQAERILGVRNEKIRPLINELFFHYGRSGEERRGHERLLFCRSHLLHAESWESTLYVSGQSISPAGQRCQRASSAAIYNWQKKLDVPG